MDVLEVGGMEVNLVSTPTADSEDENEKEFVTLIKKDELLAGFDTVNDEADEKDGFVAISPPNPEVESIMWTTLEEMIEKDLESKKKGGKRRKKPSKQSYEAIINDLETLAGGGAGLSNERLTQIWELVSHADTNLTVTQRKKLLFSMVPSEKVAGDLILKIVHWLGKAVEVGCKPTVVVTAYQLLNLYACNGLTELNGINGPVLDRILGTSLNDNRNNGAIPWKMLFVRYVCTPLTLSQFHVYALEKLLTKNDLKKTQAADVNASLIISRCTNEEEISGAIKLRTLKYPRGVPERFSMCSSRLVVQAQEASSPLEQLLFPECLSSSLDSKIETSGTPTLQIEEILKKDNGINELLLIPEKLQEFQTWLQPFIDTRLKKHVEGFCSEQDVAKYQCMFDICYKIVHTRREGLDNLNDWLATFLLSWDFQSFSGVIFKFIPYLKSSDIMKLDREVLADIFVDHFTYSQEVRLSLWDALRSLYANWIDKFFLEGDIDDIRESLKWLHATLERCAFAIVQTAQTFDENENFLVVYNIVQFYLCLQKEIDKHPQILEYFGGVPKCLAALILLSRNEQILKEAKDLIERCGDDFKLENVVTDSAAEFSFSLNMWLCGAVENRIRQSLPEGILDLQPSTIAGQEHTLAIQDVSPPETGALALDWHADSMSNEKILRATTQQLPEDDDDGAE